jgi:hypothetical protein
VTLALRIVGAVFGITVLGVAVYFLRDETMSRHTVQDRDSRMEVIIRASLRGPEPGQSVDEYALAKVLSCRTEVALADPVTELEPVDRAEGTFRFELQPGLDDADEKQFEGCMQDWSVDHLRIDVLTMTDLPAAG